ncbi:MAG: HEAT repeat domain-containing protein [bacterium]|nr:HEAT repeat domain-containing protein [bacterium]
MRLSFYVKVLIAIGALVVLLFGLIIWAITIRQQRIVWLDSLNPRDIPLEEFGTGLMSDVTPVPTPSIDDAATGIETPMPGSGARAGREAEIEREEARLADAIGALADFNRERRVAAEATIFNAFEALIRLCAAEEREGRTSDALRRVEAIFQQMDVLGVPYRFEESDARREFVGRLAAGWGRLPYVGRWASIRMMGLIGAADARDALRSAMTEGVFEDEAALALLRTGDPSAIPVLVDYIARGRIKGGKYEEVRGVLLLVDDPAVFDILISLLDNPEATMRQAALGLLEWLAAGSAEAPRGIGPTDGTLKRRWASWRFGDGASYNPSSAEPRADIIGLTVVTGFDSLPEAGRFNRAYFTGIGDEINAVCGRLSSLDREVHAEGERRLYRLARRMAEDYHAADADTARVMAQYMQVLADEVRRRSVRQTFAALPERGDFIRWATANIEQARMPALAFLLRLLGFAGDPEAAPVLRRYAQSSSPEVRDPAVLALGLLGEEAALDEIGRILSSREIGIPEAEICTVAMERIGTGKARGMLIEAMRIGRPLTAYDAYLSLKRIRGVPGRPLSVEEFEQGRGILVDEFSAWRRTGSE